MKYIIEHMDPELWDWSLLEYKHVAENVGEEDLMLTNVKESDIAKIDFCEARKEKTNDLCLKRLCILDPAAEKTLSPDDADNFDYLVFGGILGNYPPEARTKELVADGADRRNLGKDQFSTDNAVIVAKKIMDGKKLADLEFMSDFTIPIDKGEEIILPFKYLLVDGKPFISPDIVDYVKKHGF